jgi:uncharacterized protein (TIGR00369 family)
MVLRMHSPTSGTPDGTLPWTRSCFVCGQENPHGLRLRSRVANGRVVLDYTPREADLGWRQLVHGGITMTLLDEVMTWAAILAASRACVAAEISVRLRKPIRAGQPIRAEGWTTDGGTRLLRAAGQVCGADGEILAAATGKYLAMPPEELALCADDFVVSPEALQLAWLTALFSKEQYNPCEP